MRYSNDIWERLHVFIWEHKALAKLIALIGLSFILLLCWWAGRRYETGDPYRRSQQPTTAEEININFPFLAVTPLDQVAQLTDAVDMDLSAYPADVEITEGGQYRLHGTLNGTIHINAKEQNVQLFLDNAAVASRLGPALYCEEADKLVITLLPGTENTFYDSGKYPMGDELEACIYSVCDMTFNGSGSLTVNGYYKDAIRSRDIAKILDGNYTITCKRTGIHGNDGLFLSGGQYMISSEKYGLKTTKFGAEGRGNLVVSDCDMTIIAGRYAFVTEKANLYILKSVINQRSIVSPYDVGGSRYIQEGCVQ